MWTGRLGASSLTGEAIFLTLRHWRGFCMHKADRLLQDARSLVGSDLAGLKSTNGLHLPIWSMIEALTDPSYAKDIFVKMPVVTGIRASFIVCVVCVAWMSRCCLTVAYVLRG